MTTQQTDTEFTFAEFAAAGDSSFDILHQALSNLEAKENADRAMADYWAGSIGASVNGYVAKFGYGETITAK